MDTAASYDEMPYGECAFAATHPNRLAAIATLHGLTPPPVDSCRVLELGCAAGGNLIPMAITLPRAQFTGIDISPRQVAQGRETLESLGVKNVHLQAGDILEFDAEAGSFDYILCHGVYSWVPPQVQQRILQLCQRCLAPTGVAYLSYNCLPGWRIRGTIRDMLGYHVRGLPDAETRLEQSRAFLQILPEAFPNPDSLYAALMLREVESLRSAPDYYLYHEHLEELNEPLYFTEFVRRIREQGLEYLAEADASTIESRIAPDILQQLMDASSDHIEFEQYRDFLIARMFRRSLLVHSGASFSPAPRREATLGLRFSGTLRPVNEDADVSTQATEEFTVPGAPSVKTNHPVIKAALLALARSAPGRLSFDELWTEVATRLSIPPPQHEEARRALSEMLLYCHAGNAVEAHVQEAPFSLQPGERPRASPFARRQAAAGSTKLTNLNHRGAEIPDFERLLLTHLDGTRDRADLRKELLALAAADVFEIEKDGAPVSDPSQVALVLDAWIEQGLARLTRAAFITTETQ